MKKLLCAILFCNIAFLSFSQELQFTSGREKNDNKPAYFQSVSSRVSLTSSAIEDFFNYQLQQEVAIDVLPGLLFKGKVFSITNDAPGLTSIAIQSIEKNGMVLSFSKLILADQSILYRGMIQSKKYSDMLMLEKDPVTGLYNWNKKLVSHLLSD